MLVRARPWVAVSFRPLWPAEGAWLGLRMYEPPVERRLQSRLKRECTALALLFWLLMLADMMLHRPVLVSGLVPLECAVTCSLLIHVVLVPVSWCRFLVCKDLVTGRCTLYSFFFLLTTAQAQLGLIKALTDPCEFPAAWMVIARRIAFIMAFVIGQACAFYEVSIGIACLAFSNNLMYLHKIWRCNPAEELTCASLESNVRIWAVAICGIVINGIDLLLLRYKFSRFLSKQITDEVLQRANSIFLMGKQINANLSIPMTPEHSLAGDAALERLKQLNTELGTTKPLVNRFHALSLQDQDIVERIRCKRLVIIRDLCELRFFMLHQRRSLAWNLPSQVELLILDFLTRTPPTFRDEGAEFLRNAGDPFLFGDLVSSMASTSSCAASLVSRVRRQLQRA